jgi:hypothetical protein
MHPLLLHFFIFWKYFPPSTPSISHTQEEVRSRFGSVRTLAASHHQKNQAVETALARRMLCGTCDAAIGEKSNGCLCLEYGKIRLLRSPGNARSSSSNLEARRISAKRTPGIMMATSVISRPIAATNRAAYTGASSSGATGARRSSSQEKCVSPSTASNNSVSCARPTKAAYLNDAGAHPRPNSNATSKPVSWCRFGQSRCEQSYVRRR